MSFGVRITEEAFGDLARLDKDIAQRVLRRIRWLADNAEQVNRSALTGPFTGYFKLRAGVVDDDAEEIIVRAIGHRSAVYRDRS